jgi:glyoxylase-like metal-dependent hydrolase (beta-lactamase superfamily II)
MQNSAKTSFDTDMRTPRRGLLTADSLAPVATILAPRRLSTSDGSIVGKISASAAMNKIMVHSLRGNVSVLTGSGGNIAVLPGPDGMLLIDAGIAVSRRGITQALKRVGCDPIRHLVNTHWHFDHTNGNSWLHEAGASIIAHENTRKRLMVRHRVQGWSFTFPAAPSGGLPSTVFKQNLTLDLNGEHIELNYYEPAHTDTDISVRFYNADILHAADTFWNGVYPFIDSSSGGSIDGSIAAAEANVRNVDEQTIVIPGHGPVGNKSSVIEFRDMLVAVRDNVATLKEAGKTLEQTQAARPTAQFDATWGHFVIPPDLFIETVYQGV